MAIHCSDSQVALILNHLEQGNEINPMEALEKYGCFRLGAVIYVLKGEGYKIHTRIQRYKKPSGRPGHYAVYKLEVNTNELN